MAGRLIIPALLIVVLLSPASAGKFNRKLDIGDAAPGWSALPGIDGRSHGLADYKKAAVLVVTFSCNHCPVAQAYEERFIGFVKKYRSKNVRLVAISCSRLETDRLPAMKRHATERGFNFDYLYDASQNVARSYGASVTPHVFVLDQKRRVAYMGAFDDSMIESKIEERYVVDAVDALLAGREIDVTESRQRGCEIVYEDDE